MLERQTARNRQLDLCTAVGTAEHTEMATNSIRSFPHPKESPMSIAAGCDDPGANAGAVVRNEEVELGGGVIERNCNMARAGMAERVQQRLLADPVDFVAE